jgi:adenine-specific DNA-methyltransferase
MSIQEEQKARGAYFTPPAIARFLAAWAVGDNPEASVLDPTCGEAVFLVAAGQALRAAGCAPSDLDQRLYGVDIHEESLAEATRILEAEGLDAHLQATDFFALRTPDQLAPQLPLMDAVIGNPPFIRYQLHSGEPRRRAASAAFRQGVRLSGLASSWAPLLVHACGFLKSEGRLAMVLPAELLTVNYAEPVRRWLRRRFAAVNLVMFERLQFADALEKVVLVLARGSGGCDAFSLYQVEDAEGLPRIQRFDSIAIAFLDEGKWTDLLLSVTQRQLFRRATSAHFVPLEKYGSPELGTVTGANNYFALTEETRQEYGLTTNHVVPVSPPGSRHLRGTAFTAGDWKHLRDSGERVWLLWPKGEARAAGLTRYLRHGEELGVPNAYKCQVRDPWWRPPVVPPPDLFFTYMSHRFPRLVANQAKATLLNSMHGVRLRPGTKWAKSALPLLALNSVTMLGAEIYGRSYGGGVLKMEPREAARLPVPDPDALSRAWQVLSPERGHLDRQLRDGRWTSVLARVDEVLLRETLGLIGEEVAQLHEAARSLRERRLGREQTPVGNRRSS